MDRAKAKSVQPRPATTSVGASSNSEEGRSSTTAAIRQEGIAAEQLQERALSILANNQLLLRYAIANELSVPKVRVYFEQLAGGFETVSIIKKWDAFDD